MHVLIYAPIFNICVMGLYICIFMVGSVCDNICVLISIIIVYIYTLVRALGQFTVGQFAVGTVCRKK